MPTVEMEQTTLGGGCFWCTEAVFERLAGVQSVESGYAGGNLSNPTYEQVCGGNTGHAEVIQITFDPNVISYSDLLEVFFVIHDPTTMNRQGNDRGTQYRSVIFAHTPQQLKTAQEMVAHLNSTRAFSDPVVTEVTMLTNYFPAENYHQDFYRLNPNQPYCNAVIPPKLAKLQKHFSARTRDLDPPQS